MKELPIEEKAKAYDEAFKEASVAHKDEDRHLKATLERIFPELQESENERIRKALIKFHKSTIDIDGIKGDDVLAWLEKQGEKPNNVYDKELSEILGRVICRYITDPNIPYAEREKVSMEIIPYVERLEKQGKNNMGISEATKQKLEDNLNKALEKETSESWNEFLDGQKPADKVEPKFKVGDWVIDEQGIIDQITDVIENVTNHTYGYDTLNGEYFNDYTEGVRLWTIQDANDGDVLFSRSSFIYGKQCPYGGLDWYTGKFIKASNFIFKDGPVHPATKEQRSILFKKMKEAGYEWNAEKKELKKIEQNPAWSEEELDSITTAINNLEYFKNNCVYHPMGLEPAITFLKSLKDRILPQQKQEWSEEDSNMLQSILDEYKSMAIEKRNWLKSLRPQSQWKPSDEQIEALETTLYTNMSRNDERYSVLSKFVTELKKLKSKL